MPKPVHISTPPPSHEEMVRRLRVPKARQRKLRAIMDETWARLESLEKVSENPESGQEENRKNAPAAD